MAYSDNDRVPGMWTLVLAVLFPAFVILVELATGLCADALFDPLPTPGHLLLVAAVPAVNFFLWRAAREEQLPAWLAVAAGAAMAVAASYALLMLPILPVALIAIIVFGIGLLPFAPLFSLIFAWRLMLGLAEYGTHVGRKVAIGVAGGLLALALVDMPATATYLALERYRGDAAEQRAAIATMRAVGDTNLLLRMAYGDTQRATGLMSFLVSSWGAGFGGGSAVLNNEGSRELYYRLTGKPFNSVPPPGHGLSERRRWFDWDEDQGGERVGKRVTGLSLASSRIDGSIASADNLGYFEWTVEVANADAVAHEARFTIATPEGAVASRATLWIDGEPREASVAGRSEVRAAYNKVVNVQRRDPLLVTTAGAQRLLVQAFPVQAGGTIKLRVGYTAPLAIDAGGKRTVALPAIVERNFELGADVRHQLWIEGDGPLAGSGGGAPRPGGAGNGLRGAPTDAELLAHRPRIVASPMTAPSERLGSLPARDKAPPLGVIQTIAPEAKPAEPALTIVLDGSAGNAAGRALGEVLDAIPAGMPTRLLIASEDPDEVVTAPWSPGQRRRFRDAIGRARFVGGQDNVPALADALREMAGGSGILLWIHGPQPIAFSRSTAQLEQVLERGGALPALVRYQPEPGPEFTLSGVPWFERARDVTLSGDVRADLRAILAGTGAGVRWTTARREAPASGTEGSAHIVRLWGAAQLADAVGKRGKDRDAAIALAHRLNLVTPLSGAVVLEKASDYKDNGLPVPGAEDVPTVPEPEEWALLAVLAGLLAWVFRRRLRLPAWAMRREVT
jgi:hypothetical protein